MNYGKWTSWQQVFIVGFSLSCLLQILSIFLVSPVILLHLSPRRSPLEHKIDYTGGQEFTSPRFMDRFVFMNPKLVSATEDIFTTLAVQLFLKS
jgi:hypothetical protein